MSKILKKIQQYPLLQEIAIWLGVDKAIVYASSARIVQAFAGIVSIFFVGRYLTGIEQGFYYTFSSILTIQMLFELGLSPIIVQYVAYEAAHLKWVNSYTLEGDPVYKSRLGSLVHLGIKWYGVTAILLLIVLVIVGCLFFTYFYKSEGDVMWFFPWILLCIGMSMRFLLIPVSAILMGLGKMKEMSLLQFYAELIMPISAWIGLIVGFKLYVVAINTFLLAILTVVYIYSSGLMKLFRYVWNITVTEKVSFWQEVWPFQWKRAVGSLANYCVNQCTVPLLFAIGGPVAAGQMGMTLAMLNGISSLSQSWLNTKVPLFSGLIALRDYQRLDTIFNKMIKQRALVCCVLLIIMSIGIIFVRQLNLHWGNVYFGDRLVGYLPMFLMMVPVITSVYWSSWAQYLLCHKQEPYLVYNIVWSIITCASLVVLGKQYGIIGMVGGSCVITLLLLPWAYYIYKTNKDKWHSTDELDDSCSCIPMLE